MNQFTRMNLMLYERTDSLVDLFIQKRWCKMLMNRTGELFYEANYLNESIPKNESNAKYKRVNHLLDMFIPSAIKKMI